MPIKWTARRSMKTSEPPERSLARSRQLRKAMRMELLCHCELGEMIGATHHHYKIPSQQFPKACNPDQRLGPPRVIAGERVHDRYVTPHLAPPEDLTDIQTVEALAIKILWRHAMNALISFGRPFSPQIVPWRRLMTPPRREPVGERQIHDSPWSHHAYHLRQHSLRGDDVFQHIRRIANIHRR